MSVTMLYGMQSQHLDDSRVTSMSHVDLRSQGSTCLDGGQDKDLSTLWTWLQQILPKDYVSVGGCEKVQKVRLTVSIWLFHARKMSPIYECHVPAGERIQEHCETRQQQLVQSVTSVRTFAWTNHWLWCRSSHLGLRLFRRTIFFSVCWFPVLLNPHQCFYLNK